MQDAPVIIVGAGLSGLATAACLTRHSITYILLEREDCVASLWRKYSYDRLHLHLDKQFCMQSYPRFISRQQFVSYFDDYVSHFKINPLYRRTVESAEFDEEAKKWIVKARNLDSGDVEEFTGRFFAVASGETSNATGDVLHSTQFRNGKAFKNQKVLVVGSGNSGMEIAYDLAGHGAETSLVVRSPVHIISNDMAHWGLVLTKYLPLNLVDSMLVMLSKLVYGDLTKYGISRPKEGPLFMKDAYGKYPVFDVGTYKKIKSGEIQVNDFIESKGKETRVFDTWNGVTTSAFKTPHTVYYLWDQKGIAVAVDVKRLPENYVVSHPNSEVLPAISSIRGDEVLFENDKTHPFDTIVFCTGFKRSTHVWLKGDDYLLNDEGLSKQSFPNNWKGKNGLYCVGLSRKGIYGAVLDAQNIADDINSIQ